MQLAQIRFGRGRSSIARGVLSLLLAPVLAAFPVAAMLFLEANRGLLPLPDISTAVFRFTGIAAMLLKPTIALGLPTWLILRLIRFESGWIYGVLGFCEAAGVAFLFSYAFNGHVRSDLAVDFLFAGGVGALIAALFWLIANDPDGAVSKPPLA